MTLMKLIRPWKVHDIAMKKIMIVLLVLMVLPVQYVMAMTYEEETKTANEFVKMLEDNNLLVHDEEIVKPVQMLIDRLADHVKDPLYPFKIHVIKDTEVNAFTIPDGNIFIELGIFLVANDMDEISAVIGHEMGHAQLRHIPQDSKFQKPLSIATILGIIAGGLIATKNPEAGGAMIYSAIGGSQNIMLAHSREHEYAADNFGKETLIASGLDPGAMARFLIGLQTIYGPSSYPEYLLTHPFTENRIAILKVDPGNPKPDKNYWILKASVIGLLLSEGEVKIRVTHMPEPYKSLALGLLQTRIGNSAQALSLLSNIDLPIANAYKGVNLYALGRKTEAYPLLKTYANSSRTKMALANIYQERGEYKEAIDILLPYQSQDLRVDYTLGGLYDKTLKPALANVSYARYFFETGKYKASLYHIDQALKAKDQLSKDVVTELNSMEETIKKSHKGEGNTQILNVH
jgi:predicted Zn-dependent protease